MWFETLSVVVLVLVAVVVASSNVRFAVVIWRCWLEYVPRRPRRPL